jgi:hypothetical protein
MIHVIWEFEVHIDRVAEFLWHYSADGTWAQLFRRSPAYKETILVQDIESSVRFVTIDTWADRSSFENFKRAFQSDYEILDRRCEPLTLSEHFLGVFEAV